MRTDIQTDRQTDMTKFIVDFRNLLTRLKKRRKIFENKMILNYINLILHISGVDYILITNLMH